MKHDHEHHIPGDHRSRGLRRPDVTDPITGSDRHRRGRRPEGFGPRGAGGGRPGGSADGSFGPGSGSRPGGSPDRGYGRFGPASAGAPDERRGGPERGFGPGFTGGPDERRGGPERGFGPGFTGGPDGRLGGPDHARGGFGGPHGEFRGRGPGRGPGRRAGRGDIRAAVLLLLSEQPMHGYQLIQEIAQRSDGSWRPSPGAIYPALALLEDEGLVVITAEGGRKLASLTETGTAYVTENAAEIGSPFEDAAARPSHPGRALRESLEALGAAAGQVGRTGTEEQAKAALAVLDRARRDLYLILAGEPTPTTTPEPTDS